MPSCEVGAVAALELEKLKLREMHEPMDSYLTVVLGSELRTI